MHPFVTGSHFFQNHHKGNIVATVTISNPNNIQMHVTNSSDGSVTILDAHDTITAVFRLFPSGFLSSLQAGQAMVQNVVLGL
jgi:hypothetical protein